MSSLRHLDSKTPFSQICLNVKNIAYSHFNNFKQSDVFSPIFNLQDLRILKNFCSNPDIVICKPDKGRGVVILDKTLYKCKIKETISNPDKFSQIHQNIIKYSKQIEDKINRFLSSLKSKNVFSDLTYKSLFCSGTGPGTLYGLPKTHKANFSSKPSFRPIFAAYNTASYKISKFLVPILQPLTTNQYTINNSKSFLSDLSTFTSPINAVMASLDVESLFSNIPLIETIEICIKLICLHVTTRSLQ